MKKLVLLAIVATFATSAFAQKGLVELQGCFDGTCDQLDFDMESVTNPAYAEDADEESQNLALNYNHLFTDNFGAGLVYIQSSATVDGDIKGGANGNTAENSTTTGINLFWNLSSGWMGDYVALRYWMTSTEASDDVEDDETDTNITVLEYGTRVALGKALGVSFAWNPSVSYTMTSGDAGDNAGTEDRDSTQLSLNLVNFAAAF